MQMLLAQAHSLLFSQVHLQNNKYIHTQLQMFQVKKCKAKIINDNNSNRT